MTTNIKPWGNSQGVYIPKDFLTQLGWKNHENIEMRIEDDKIIISKMDDLEVKRRALETLQQYRMSGVHLDYREEMNKYLDERYGNV